MGKDKKNRYKLLKVQQNLVDKKNNNKLIIKP